ncbi:MAG: UvrD-helicase domain-containing protein [Polyangiales bacterium]
MSARINPPRLVSAGAGTGKTWRIVQSIVERVRTGVSIDRIAAVTFTEAAAAELQDRVRAGLLAHGLDEQAARVDVAVICTIHRFALTLLQRYPLAAGLPPEPIVLDEDQAATLRRSILAEELYRDDDAATRAMLDAFLGPGVGLAARGWGDGDTPAGRLQSLVREVLEKGRSIAMTPERLEREGSIASQRLLDAMGPAGDEAILDRDMAEGLTLAYAWIDKNPEPKRKGDFGFYEALRALRSERGLAPFDVALRVAACEVTKTTEKDVAALLTAARASAKSHPALRQRLADGVRRVFSLSARVLARYGEDKARMGAVDFEDMQLIALELIAGRASGREAYAELIAKALPYIVVDEFQDTSPLQFRLFEALREAGAEVRYVGDLKQGIYGFRSADSTLFAALLTRAEAEGDKAESLDRSRRSRPELVEFANALFGALMPPSGLPFAPLTAENRYSQGACPKTSPSLDVVMHPLKGAAKIDAGVERILDLVASGTPVFDRAKEAPRPARYGDVAVLAYTHDGLAKWSEALRARGVSSVLAARGLFETLEAQLARQWLRMIASPRDRSAAAAVLLSELYGISQRTMVRLTLARVSGSPARALELHGQNPVTLPLTDFERRALLRCRDDLADCREALRQLPLPEAVERAFERVGLADRLAMRLDEASSAQARANLARLVSIAHDLAMRGDVGLDLAGATGVTLENYLLALERAERDDPWQPLAGDDAPDSVKLVTMHASKGMEYPLVVLDALDRKLDVRLPRVEVVRPGELAVMLGPEALTESGVQIVPDVGVDDWKERFQQLFDGESRQRQELLRLLYVAVTRARDHLVLLWPEESKSGTTAYLRSLITARVKAPAVATSSGAEGEWLGQRVRVYASSKADEADEPEDDAPPTDLAAWRALAEMGDPEAPGAPSTMTAPRLARVSPSELCQVADCPEVPRLMRFARGERHALARADGVSVGRTTIPDARRTRLAIGDKIPPSRIGALVHAAVERASLLAPTSRDEDLALAERVFDICGETEHRELIAELVADTLASLRATALALRAVEEPAREVPFAVDLRGTTLRGVIDLVVRAPEGLHVVDLKTHPLKAPDLDRWAAYYAPQLDAYALAVARLTGEPVLGRHLAIPAAGTLVTLPGDFDAKAAEASLMALSDALARGDRGPTRDCALCGWQSSCRRGRAVLRDALTPSLSREAGEGALW